MASDAPAPVPQGTEAPFKRALRRRVRHRLSVLAHGLLTLGSGQRMALVLLADVGAVLLATFIAYAIRVGEFAMPLDRAAYLTSLGLFAWLFVGWRLKLYRLVLRYFGFESIYRLGSTALVTAVFMGIVLLAYAPFGSPRTMALLQPMVMFLLAASSRLSMSIILSTIPAKRQRDRRHVLVYGAGAAAKALSQSIRFEKNWKIVGFVDPTGALDGRQLEGKPIMGPATAAKFLPHVRIDDLFLAIESRSRHQRRDAVELVHDHWPKAEVRIVPRMRDVASGSINISDLREVRVQDLLGRDPVEPLPDLLDGIEGETVMVTGAGGSIGSELVRQLIALNPARIVLAERNEYQLYAIDEEVAALVEAGGYGCQIVPVLIDLCNARQTQAMFEKYRPDRVLHAAAYKHVPLVETNRVAGIGNNVQSTINCCLAAERVDTRRFTLVSTDKAVRPTNVMGASKRLCELIVQARAEIAEDVVYSSVRFGNVLGSSGSVVPKFEQQIAAGGPITITHRDVTRFFMTIPEAALLVIQAGAMATRGDLFLLDMGQPVRILDLARSMVDLSGLRVRDADRPDGDIEIVETGLRPGEKLYEELLIDASAEMTDHPRIVRAHESFVAWESLSISLARLDDALDALDDEAAVAILREHVSGFAEREEDAAVAA